MDLELGEGWADAVSKILRMGKNNPESNKFLSKAKKDFDVVKASGDGDKSGSEDESADEATTTTEETRTKLKSTCGTARLKPDPQADALLENELRDYATRGVVHLFNAVKAVNPKSDKKGKKKKKKKKKTKKSGKRR